MTRIESTLTEDVVTLRLASPETSNALSPQDYAELTREVDRWERPASGARALILTATGSVFSAGADLNALNDADADGLANSISASILPLHGLLASGRLPTIAAVNGPAVGGAIGLALMCDIVLAARSARFSLAFARLGLIPDSGLTQVLPRLVGEARARAWMMTGADVCAEEAASSGMILRCVDDTALADEAMSLAKRLARLPLGTHQVIRTAMVSGRVATFEQQIALESRCQAERVGSKEFRDAVSAFSVRQAARRRSEGGA